MNTRKILKLLVLFLITGQTLVLAQIDGLDTSTHPLMERIRILPDAQNNPAQSALPQGSWDQPAPIPGQEAFPAHHLWGDIDNDGLQDIFVLDAQGNLMFHNIGDGGFEDVTAKAFPDGAGKGSDGLFGDYDQDGWLDLFVSSQEGCTLYRNHGSICFSDVTEEAGLDSKLSVRRARLFDYDGDGFEDLLLETPQGDLIYHNQNGYGFDEMVLGNKKLIPSVQDSSTALIVSKAEGKGSKKETSLDSVENTDAATNRLGRSRSDYTGMVSGGSRENASGSEWIPPAPPFPELGGPSTGSPDPSPALNADARFLNDNSPGSVGEGIPEVEGGDDGTTDNDIVDGTVTGADIQDDSVPADKVTGTAATLTGNQNFDSGTLYINATNNRVGIGTTTPTSSSLHVVGSSNYGCRVENSDEWGYAVFGEATAATGGNAGVWGESASESGHGVHGEATHPTGITYGVWGESSSTTGRGVLGYVTASTGETFGVYGASHSETGRGVYGRSWADTGENYGVYGKSDSTEGIGVFGYTDTDTGYAYGVRGESDSFQGRGIYGNATSTTGNTYGVLGKSDSNLGCGVYGIAAGLGVHGRASQASGNASGVFGESLSTEARAVWGYASSSSGETFGVYGKSNSDSGRGVYGYADATTGNAYGVQGTSDSSEGRGIYGTATATTGKNYGVRGRTASTTGRGVYGAAAAVTGTNYGVKGHSDSDEGYGVYGSSPNIGVKGVTTGNEYGVYGEVDSVVSSAAGVCGIADTAVDIAYSRGIYGESGCKFGVGVYGYSSADWTNASGDGVVGVTDAEDDGAGVIGRATDAEGGSHGVIGNSPAKWGYAIYSQGNLACTGIKAFVQPHPTDLSKEIHLVCLEGNESGTYFRGSSELAGGKAVIEIPEEIRLVTEPEGLTVQLTPSGPALLWIEEKSLERIVVRGDMDVEFDYFVNGVRRGFSEIELIRENRTWVPEFRGKPFGTQYPDALRRILVENGTLNPDFTPNQSAATKMGWKLRDFDEVYPSILNKRERASLKNQLLDQDPDEPERVVLDSPLPSLPKELEQNKSETKALPKGKSVKADGIEKNPIKQEILNVEG
ncbi:MAG: FG-GAP-like repeat-containing protein [Planctomycetota bacterium]|jgi:hypothetical protein